MAIKDFFNSTQNGIQDLFNSKQNREEKERLEKVIQEIGGMDYLAIKRKTDEAIQYFYGINQQCQEAQRTLSIIKNEITANQQEFNELSQILGLAKEIQQLEAVLKSKKAEIIVADEMILMESFAVYKPTYQFATADDYKDKLDYIRSKQKDLIKSNRAATGSSTWTVNGSATQGRKLVSDMIKLCLRSFNNECDDAVSSVKFNNYERCKERINKSAEAIRKLGKIMSVEISCEYISLKHEELTLALEYQIQKQKEKEELKELRAQQREEAKIAKELEEARKASLKEQQHYTRALDTVNKKITECKDIEEKNALLEKQKELEETLNRVSKEIDDIDYRVANHKAGYVYVISNIGAFGEGVYKIGMTRRLEPQDRVDELGDASVPFNFDIHAMIFSENAPALENALHKEFADYRLNYINNRREFFKVPLEEIKRVVKEHHDRSVEFIDVPDAVQYRETLKLKGEDKNKKIANEMEMNCEKSIRDLEWRRENQKNIKPLDDKMHELLESINNAKDAAEKVRRFNECMSFYSKYKEAFYKQGGFYKRYFDDTWGDQSLKLSDLV